MCQRGKFIGSDIYKGGGKGRGEAGLGESQILHPSISPPSLSASLPPSFLLTLHLSLTSPPSLPVSLAPDLPVSVSSFIFPFSTSALFFLSAIPSTPRSRGTGSQQPCTHMLMALRAERKGVFSASSILILKDTERLGLGYMPISVTGERVT